MAHATSERHERVADPYSRARRKSLLQLFSSSTSDWVAKVRAGDAGKANKAPKAPIEWPTLSILAGTTPSTFYEGLEADAFTSGLMARLLVIAVEQPPPLNQIEGFPSVFHFPKGLDRLAQGSLQSLSKIGQSIELAFFRLAVAAIKRPALIALNLVDQISQTELQTLLNTPNGLHAITHAVFKKTERLHVDSLAFTVPQTARTESGATWLSGSAIVLNNPNPQFPCSEIRSIFQSAPVRP
jgi:hypothetical protein